MKVITRFANGDPKPAEVTGVMLREVTKGGGAFTNSRVYQEPVIIETSLAEVADRRGKVIKASYTYITPVGEDRDSLAVYAHFDAKYHTMDLIHESRHKQLMCALPD